MVTLGERLKEAREGRGVALDEVHASTRIQKRYLEALEAQDWDAVPGGVFTQGYLRTYAEYLGLNPQLVLRAYARERRIEHAAGGIHGKSDEREATRVFLERIAQTREIDLAGRRRTIRRVALGLATAAVAAAAVGWGVLRVHATRADAAGPAPPAPEVQASGRVLPTGSVGEQEPFADSEIPAVGATLPTPAAIPDFAPPPSWSPAVETVPAHDGPACAPEAGFVPLPPASRLSVPQHGVGRRVVGRQLVDESADFVEGKVVWFWTRVAGGRPGDRVHHVWIHEGRRVEVVELKLGGSQWRTQSRRRMAVGAAGEWTVEARDPSGQLLASAQFRVAPR